MVTLTNRQIEIIKFLLKKDTYITIENISNIFDISQRTVRSDLDSIEYVLKEYESSLERKPRVGIKLNFVEKEIETILTKLDNRIYSAEERAVLILIIIMTQEKNTFEELAKKIKVSKNTVIQDLKYSEKLIKEYGIKINKRSYQGIFLDGNEEKIRNCLFYLYKKSDNYIKTCISKYLYNDLKVEKNIIDDFIDYIEKSVNVKYSQEALDEIEIMLSFAICRIGIGRFIQYEQDYIYKQKKNANFSIIKNYKNNLKYTITESEICYFLKIFSAAKITLGNFITTNDEVDKLAACIINDMCKVINIDYIEDAGFREQIVLHLKVAVFRMENNFLIENPMLEEIKYKMSFVYSITEKILTNYEDKLKVKFPESEIAYITMYFDALIEKNLKDRFSFRILIICNGGLATSSLLKARIESTFSEIKVSDICRLRDVRTNLEKYDIDFLVSTVPLELDDYKVIQVNPLLELSDIEKIKSEIFNRSYESNCRFLAKKAQDKKVSLISEILPEKYTQINLEVSDWYKAIEIAAQPLIKDNKIKKQYVSEIIKVIETLGNYMVFIPEIAFVHADPTYVIENSVSILVLKNPINFGSKKKTLVKVIIVLANKNENMNLVNLTNIITKAGNVNKLKQAKCYQDIKNIV